MSGSNLDHVSDEELVTVIHSTKGGILRAIDHHQEHAQSFHLGMMVLEILEKEVKRRGGNPSDKKYGRDIIGEIIQTQIKEYHGTGA
jgi:hypothetical protein